MKTRATDQWPEIDWEIGAVLSTDPEEREVVFAAKGVDAAGNEYEGWAVYSCGEFERMEGIELTKSV